MTSILTNSCACWSSFIAYKIKCIDVYMLILTKKIRWPYKKENYTLEFFTHS